MTGQRLLLVDDDAHLRELLEAALRYSGFEVSTVGAGRSALTVLDHEHVDLVLLDVRMPDLDGFEVFRRLRATGSQVPVVFLSACDDTDEKVRGLAMGADDFITKPFSLEELVARIRTVLRRSAGNDDASILRCADLVMDDAAHLVTRAGEEVALTPTEYNLLRYLLVNQGRVLSKGQLLSGVWNYEVGDGAVVETYIRYLRRKIDHVAPHLIRTVRGVGYGLRMPVAPLTSRR